MGGANCCGPLLSVLKSGINPPSPWGERTMRRNLFWRFWPIVLPILLGSTVVSSRSMGKDPDRSTTAPSESDPKIASAARGGLTPVELASRLEVAKQQEERLDIELRSGKSYIRCKLLRL